MKTSEKVDDEEKMIILLTFDTNSSKFTKFSSICFQLLSLSWYKISLRFKNSSLERIFRFTGAFLAFEFQILWQIIEWNSVCVTLIHLSELVLSHKRINECMVKSLTISKVINFTKTFHYVSWWCFFFCSKAKSKKVLVLMLISIEN